MKEHLMKGVPIGGIPYENAIKIHQAATALLYRLQKLLRANKIKEAFVGFHIAPSQVNSVIN